MHSRLSFKTLVPLTAIVLVGASFIHSAEASPAAFQPAAFKAPAFLQSVASAGLPVAALVMPVAVLGPQSSVMPPNPAFGVVCSTNVNGGSCSAVPANTRCSAQNGNGNFCSTFGPGTAQCSTTGQYAVCSVLPPQIAGGQDSFCSTFSETAPHQCSVTSQARGQRCSTKGVGFSQCSTHVSPTGQTGPADCSVLNLGANFRSFCSTKFNQPGAIAKNCSTFSDPTACSVIQGGKGQCTTFGAAFPGSCSAFTPNSHCSVIGGGAGNPCVQ